MKREAAKGAVLGFVLMVVCFLTAGYGHGIYVMIGLAGAPFAFLGVFAALLSMPFIWAFLFAFSRTPGLSRGSHARAVCALTLHYISAAFILMPGSSNYADWNDWPNLPNEIRSMVYLGALLYLFGNLLVWSGVIKNWRQNAV